jgi:hypothetical protein
MPTDRGNVKVSPLGGSGVQTWRFQVNRKLFVSCNLLKPSQLSIFLRGYVKDRVYVPPLPRDLPELRLRIMDGTYVGTCVAGARLQD